VTSDIDLDLDTILDSMELGAMLEVRLDKGRWGLDVNGLYVDLSAETDRWSLAGLVSPGLIGSQTDLGLTLWAVEVTGHYRFSRRWTVLAGGRYYQNDVDLKISPLFGPGRKASISENWLDPIVGIEYNTPISERWSFGGRGDIGGFGAGSDFAWQLQAMFECRMSEHTSLGVGYCHLDWDYESGSGQDRFGLDTYMTGPFVGMRFRF
jgi:hypothetical protein